MARGVQNAGDEILHESVELTSQQITRANVSQAFKAARIGSWFGILMTAACLGIGTTLVNNWMTLKKVKKELHETYEPLMRRFHSTIKLTPRLQPS